MPCCYNLCGRCGVGLDFLPFCSLHSVIKVGRGVSKHLGRREYSETVPLTDPSTNPEMEHGTQGEASWFFSAIYGGPPVTFRVAGTSYPR